MKKLLLLFCSLLLVAGCGKPAATLPTVIGSGSVDIPAYKITAPAAGKILGLILESGERIGKGQPLFAIERSLTLLLKTLLPKRPAPMLSLLTWKAEAVNRP